MAFKRRPTWTAEAILDSAEAEADRLGVESYLIVVRRKGALVTISEPEELKQADEFIGIVTDAKGGRR